MNQIKRDDWELFLEERHRAPGWQWPLNLAVALHLTVFAGAIVLPDLTARTPQFTDIVMVDLIDLGGLPGPVSTSPLVLPETAVQAVEMTEAAAPQAASAAPVLLTPERMVKKSVSRPPAQELAGPEPIQPEVAPEVAVIEPEAKLKTAAQVTPQEETRVEEVTPSVASQESISLTPEQRKVAVERTEDKRKAEEAKAVQLAADKKKAEEVKAAKLAEEKKKAEEAKAVQLAADKKKAEEVKAAKLAEEKKKAEEAKAVQLAADKKKAEEVKAAKLAEEKKKAEEVRQQRLAQEQRAREAKRQAEEAKVAEAQRKRVEQERQKALAEARRIEREAEQALAEAEEARKQLAQALRQNTVVRSAVASVGTGGGGIRGGSGSGVISNQYTELLNGKISSHWKVPELVKAKPDLKTQVVLTVRNNGSIENMKIERKSGDALFDQSVLRALQSAEPLPSFPALMSQPALEVLLNFTPKGLTL
jgi:colicin import membrane protein